MGSLVTSREPASRDELFVERLRNAGAVFLGKTNTSEFGLAAQTMNRLGPSTANPWNLERTAGGSSGGAAAACSAGYGPLHHGTDGGGSVRVPAAYCGVVGLKPTGRRIPRRARGAGMSQIATDGVLARTIADAALVLDITAGPHPDDPGPFGGRGIDFVSAAGPASLEGVRIACTTQLGGPTPCEPLIAKRVEDSSNHPARCRCISSRSDSRHHRSKQDLPHTVRGRSGSQLRSTLRRARERSQRLHARQPQARSVPHRGAGRRGLRRTRSTQATDGRLVRRLRHPADADQRNRRSSTRRPD